MTLKRHCWIGVIGCLAVAAPTSTLRAQLAAPDVTVTPKPVGSGARALGQSAFIAVADDATAASWNPAGLTQLERPEFSVVGAWLDAVNHFSSSSADIAVGREAWSQPELNFVSFAYPLTVANRDLVLSLNYHQVYDFGLDVGFRQTVRGAGTVLPLDLNVQSEGGVSATSLAGGFPLTPSLAFGLAVNAYHNGLYGPDAWEVTTEATGAGTLAGLPVSFDFHNTEQFDRFHAWNVTVGMMWDIWARDEQMLTFGCVLHSPYTAEVNRRSKTTSILRGFGGAPTVAVVSEDYEIDFPLSVGAGVNYRASDAWSIAGDVQWTDWSKFEQEDERGVRTSPIGGGPTGNLSDTVAARLGTEYLIFLDNAVLALRGGLFYEPRPALGTPMDVYGFSVGTGLSTRQFSVDFAYQFRCGQSKSGANLGLSGDTSFRTEEHWFVASVIVYF